MPELTRLIISHIVEDHVEEFVIGNYGGFDRLAARAAAEVKKQYPQIRLVQLQPYLPSEKKEPLPQGFDGGWYPDGMETVPPRYAIVRANRAAIDQADCLIAYVWHTASNAQSMLEYAQKRAQNHPLQITLIDRSGLSSRKL